MKMKNVEWKLNAWNESVIREMKMNEAKWKWNGKWKLNKLDENER